MQHLHVNLMLSCVLVGMQVVPCLAMYDTMKYIQSDVGTVAFGGAMGMSGFLLAVGTKVRSCPAPDMLAICIT